MTECVVQSWQYWMIAGLVAVTGLIVWVATWTYMQDRYQDLLRVQAADERSRQGQTQNIRIREAVYGNVHLGDLEVRDEG